MSRNRTPTAILDAKGVFQHDPQRKREDEPTTDRPLGSAPRRLSPEEKEVWKDLADQALPGVVMYSDRNMFEMLVVLTTKFRSRGPMMAAERNLMVSLSSRFAMTPADRSKVSVEKPKQSQLSKFLAPRPAPKPEDETVQ